MISSCLFALYLAGELSFLVRSFGFLEDKNII